MAVHRKDVAEGVHPIDVFGSRVDAISYERMWELITSWTRQPEPRRICLAGIPPILFSRDCPEFREAHGSADIVIPDGMPLVWALRRAGYRSQERLDGPNLAFRLCEDAERHGVPVGFYGSSEDTVRQIRENMMSLYPKLDLRLCKSAPFRPMTEAEELADVDEINQSGARLLFVGLSCPKQELWMGRHRDRLMVTAIAFGAAFDVAAGLFDRPPMWVQRSGLQWFYRVIQEPRRLWRRYLFQNTRYLGLVIWNWLGGDTNLP